MRRHLFPLALSGVLLLGLSCDRERSNPIDPQSSILKNRPTTPVGIVAEGSVGTIRLLWQPVDERNLAGYAVFRAERSNGEYAFVQGDGDSTAQITTGKTDFVDSLAAPGQTFFYRVAAVDTAGLVSELSIFVGATVLDDNLPPAAPQNLSAVADENVVGRIVVRWTSPTRDTGGGELTGVLIPLTSRAGRHPTG